jgi:leader peptidase (prepilin peptidase)/N-methyltransferase
MEAMLPLAGVGFALGWPIELTIRRFPRGAGTTPSTRRLVGLAVLTAVLFALLALVIGPHARLVPALILTALVVPAAAIDLEHRIIPNAINLPGAALVFVAAVAAEPGRWWILLLGGAGAFLFLAAAWRVSPGGMGMGDVKMALMIGLGLGQYAAVALFMALVLALLPSLFVIVRHGVRAGRKVGLPFGPFLAAGAIIALLYGPQILHAYLAHGV